MANDKTTPNRPAAARPRANAPTGATAVRNTPIPRSGAGRREITHDEIARRAYEIYASGAAGSPTEHWLRAERELRG